VIDLAFGEHQLLATSCTLMRAFPVKRQEVLAVQGVARLVLDATTHARPMPARSHYDLAAEGSNSHSCGMMGRIRWCSEVFGPVPTIPSQGRCQCPLGLPAFKMLGASWATYRCLAKRAGRPVDASLPALRVAAGELPPTTLVTATDGNHGRAVARMARYLDLPAIVLVPSVVPAAAMERIRGEGAEVRVVDAPYDDTVREAAALCEGSDERILVQDVPSDEKWTAIRDRLARGAAVGAAATEADQFAETGGYSVLP
jgi:hypothetical protein